MQRLHLTPGVGEAVGDQCRFGLLSPGENGTPGPAKKLTRFLSSAGYLLRELGHRCQGDHKHVQLLGGRRAADAAVYPRGLCKAILRGISAQRQREGRDPLGVARARATGTGIYELAGEDAAELSPVAAIRLCSGTAVTPEPEQTRVGDEAEML